MAPYAANYFVRPVNGLDTNDGLTFATAFKTTQKGLDTCAAQVGGSILGLCAEADEAIATPTLDDTHSGLWSGETQIQALNAVGELDGTKYWLDGENTSTGGLYFYAKNYKRYIGVCCKNMVNYGFYSASGISLFLRFEKCETQNCGTIGFRFYTSTTIYVHHATMTDCISTLDEAAFYSGIRMHSNRCIAKNTTTIQFKPTVLNGSVQFYNNCIGTGAGSWSFYYGNALSTSFIQCTADDCLYGFGTNAQVYGIWMISCRITNNTHGIYITGASTNIIWADNCAWYGNTTKLTLGARTSFTETGSIDMASDGYVDQAGGNLTLTAGAEGRRVGFQIDSFHTAYQTAGLPGQDYAVAPAPSVPTGQVLQAFNKSLLLQSSFVANATGIKVFRDTDPGGAFPEITASPFSTYGILDDNNGAGLAEDTPYYYKLKGTGPDGDSAFSAIFAGRTIIGKDHPRKAIRDKAVAMLNGKVYLDSTAINVFKTRFLPLYPDELPALGVYIVDEPADHEETAPREYKRKPVLKIDIVLKKDHIDDPDDQLDYIAKQVEDLFFINNTLDDLVADLFLTNTAINPKVDGEDIYLGAILSFELEYYTAAPEEQGPPLVQDFKTANTKIGPGGETEQIIEAETELPQS